MFAEHAPYRSANQFASDRVGAFELAFVFEFQLPGNSRKRRINIGDTRHRSLFASASRPLLGAADETFKRRNRQALADPRTAVNALVLTSLKRNLFHNVAKISRYFHLAHGIARNPGFLRGDGHPLFKSRRIVSTNFRANAILQRSDDFSARRVVLRIRRKYDKHVEWQA